MGMSDEKNVTTANDERTAPPRSKSTRRARLGLPLPNPSALLPKTTPKEVSLDTQVRDMLEAAANRDLPPPCMCLPTAVSRKDFEDIVFEHIMENMGRGGPIPDLAERVKKRQERLRARSTSYRGRWASKIQVAPILGF